MSIPRLPAGLRAWTAALACALVLPAAAGEAQAPSAGERLAAEIAARAPLMDNLEELCDGIGPRMTGSASLREAQSWAMKKLAQYGASSVRLEAYDMGKPWRRGRERAVLLNANRMPLDVL